MDPDEAEFKLVMCKLDNAQKTLFNLKLSVLAIPTAVIISVITGNLTISSNSTNLLLYLIIIYCYFIALFVLYFQSRTEEYDAKAKYIIKNIRKRLIN